MALRKSHTRMEWEAQKDTIVRLYTKEKVKLKDLPKVMESEYNFVAK
jgi:Clr5 domain